jgi:hypothetical protein
MAALIVLASAQIPFSARSIAMQVEIKSAHAR